MKFNSDVKKNLYYVSAISMILCVIMLAGFWFAGQFSLKVLLGAFIGTSLTIFNFFLLAFTLNKAVDSENRGKVISAFSYTARNLMLFILGILAIVILKVNPVALLLPYIFPRLSIFIIHALNYRHKDGGE